MTIVTAILTIVICLAAFFLPRRLLIFPFIFVACFVPMNQRFIVADLDFTVLRIILISTALRMYIRGETRPLQLNKVDKLVLAWNVVGTVVYIVQWSNFQALIYKSGIMIDCLGMYWLLRQAIRKWSDISDITFMFAIFAIVTAPLIALEKFHPTSFFSLFGNVATSFHAGRFRCAGSFPHYIMMGTFWAVLLPYFYAAIKKDNSKSKLFFWCAILSSLSNVYFSASSTPVITVIAVIAFWWLFPIRRYGKILFLGSCGCLLFLHLAMKAPVWHLIARANVFGGSTGWHRYHLFDNFIRNIPEWFLIGTKSTAHWGFGLQDVTNQFVLEAVRGGFVTLSLFSAVVYFAIKIPGQISLDSSKPEVQWIAWGACVAMLSHFVTFWGVSYFGQMNMILYFSIAIAGFAKDYRKKMPES